MANDKDKNLQGVYQTLKKEGYEPPKYEQFASDMKDEANLQGVYDTLKREGYEPPSFDTFKADMGWTAPQTGGNQTQSVQSAPQESQSAPQQQMVQASASTVNNGVPEVDEKTMEAIQEEKPRWTPNTKPHPSTAEDKAMEQRIGGTALSSAMGKVAQNMQNQPKAQNHNFFKLRRGGKDFEVDANDVEGWGGLIGWAERNGGLEGMRVWMKDSKGVKHHVLLELASQYRKEKGYKYVQEVRKVQGEQSVDMALGVGATAGMVEQTKQKLQQTYEANKKRYEARMENPLDRGAVDGGMQYNPETGKMEETYILPSGETTFNKEGAEKVEEQYQGHIDAQVAEEKEHARQISSGVDAVWDAANEEYSKQYVDSGINGSLDGFNNVDNVYQRVAGMEQMKDANFDFDKMADQVLNTVDQGWKAETLMGYENYFKNHMDEGKGKTAKEKAENALRVEALQQIYQKAVEANAPKSVLDGLTSKIGQNNVLNPKTWTNLFSQNKGRVSAEQAALEQWGTEHPVLNAIGVVGSMATDPLMYVAGPVGKVFGWGAMKLGGALTSKGMAVGSRWLSTKLGGRILGGVAGGAGNFMAFEGMSNARQQIVTGNYNPETGETGEFEWGQVGSSMAHGLMLGGITGSVAPALGNVFGDWIRGTQSTIGKVGLKTGEYASAAVLEGTIFAAPELYKLWTDEGKTPWSAEGLYVLGNEIGTMAAFKGHGALKDASRAMDAVSNQGRMSVGEVFRKMLDAPKFEFTSDNHRELRENGYGRLDDLLNGLNRGDKDRKVSWDMVRDLINNPKVSRDVRAKVFYVATGKPLASVSIINKNIISNADGTVTVQSVGVTGEVVTSRTYATREKAKSEIESIDRQSELNIVAFGEQQNDGKIGDQIWTDAVKAIAPKHDPKTMFEMYVKDLEGKLSKGEQKKYGRILHDIDIWVGKHKGDEAYATADKKREGFKLSHGVDIDEALRKQPSERSEQEQIAIDKYMQSLGMVVEDPAVTAIKKEAEDKTHAQSGMIQPAVMKQNDRQVYITDGEVVMHDDGKGVDTQHSDESVFVKDKATGKKDMASPTEILRTEEPIDPAEEVNAAIETRKAEQQMAIDSLPEEPKTETEIAEGKAVGKGEELVGSTIKVMDADGKEKEGYVTSVKDGEAEVVVDGEREPRPMSVDEIYKTNSIEPNGADGANMAEGATEVTEHPVAEPQRAIDRIPVKVVTDEKGNEIEEHDFESAEVGDTSKALLETFGKDDAHESVDAEIAKYDTQIAELDKGRVETTGLGVSERMKAKQQNDAIDAQKAELEGKRKYWEDVKAELEKPEEEVAEDIQPIGKNKFGNIYNQFKGKVKEAFDFLLQKKEGYLQGVFHRDEIGDIDVAWGDAPTIHTGKGLAHIFKKHVDFYEDFKSEEDAINTIQDVVEHGEAYDAGNNTWHIEKGDYRVVIARDENGNWILSAFDYKTSKKDKLNRKEEKKGSVTPLTPNQTAEAEEAGAVASNLSQGKDTTSSAEMQGNTEKSSVRLSEKEQRAKDEVSSIVKPLNSDKVQYHVYGNEAEIEDADVRADVKNKQKERDENGNRKKPVFGWTHPVTTEVNGKKVTVNHVFLMADNLSGANRKELAKTVLHESVQHVGLKEMLGEKGFNRTMQHIWKEWMSDDAREEKSEYVWDQNYNADEREALLKGSGKKSWEELTDEQRQMLLNNKRLNADAADEWAADQIETDNFESKEGTTWYGRLISDLRNWLRAHGFGDIELTKDDLRQLWRKAEKETLGSDSYMTSKDNLAYAYSKALTSEGVDALDKILEHAESGDKYERSEKEYALYDMRDMIDNAIERGEAVSGLTMEQTYGARDKINNWSDQHKAVESVRTANELNSQKHFRTKEDLEPSDEKGLSMGAKAIKEETDYETPDEKLRAATRFSYKTMPDWGLQYIKDGKSPRDEEIVKRIGRWYNNIAADMAVRGRISPSFAEYGKASDLNKDGVGPLRGNVEYSYTFDMDTTCPRTMAFLSMSEYARNLLKRPMTIDEAQNLIEMMRANGLEIPCVYCYAENKRQALSESMLSYMQYRQDVINAADDGEAFSKMYGHKKAGDNTSPLTSASEKVMAEWRSKEGLSTYNPSMEQLYDDYGKARKKVMFFLDLHYKNGKINPNMSDDAISKVICDSIIKEEDAPYAKAVAASVRDIANEWRYDAIEQLASPNSTMSHRDVMGREMQVLDNALAFRNVTKPLAVWDAMVKYGKSSSSAHNSVRYMPYTSELKDPRVLAVKDEINAMGGFRLHSSNDFRIDYVGDYLQFFADLAQGGWKSHSYSKSPLYVELFGGTGARINMSIAGYDVDGKVIENQSEGHVWKTAMELRKKYPNAGTMFMTTSAEQLQYALDADWVDMIIPFHSSGLPKRVWYDMRAWEDAQSTQNEAFYNGEHKKSVLAGMEFTDDDVKFMFDTMKEDVKSGNRKANNKLSEMLAKRFEDVTRDEIIDAYMKGGASEIDALYGRKKQHKEIVSYEKDKKTGKMVKKVLRPHFLPGESRVEVRDEKGNKKKVALEGWLIEGVYDAENIANYMRLCEEYGVQPRFHGIMVKDKAGNDIPVEQHPGYIKLIKEAARTDSPQEAVKFNLDEPTEGLYKILVDENGEITGDPVKGMFAETNPLTGEGWTAMDYATYKLKEFAQTGGYDVNNLDPTKKYLVEQFVKDYIGKPLGYMSEADKASFNMLWKKNEYDTKGNLVSSGEFGEDNIPYHSEKGGARFRSRFSDGRMDLPRVISSSRDYKTDTNLRHLKSVANTLHTSTFETTEQYLREPDGRVRKFTPRERLRLMGVPEEYADRMIDAGISRTQIHRMTGNSIVTNVLEGIFDKMFVNTKAEVGEQGKDLTSGEWTKDNPLKVFTAFSGYDSQCMALDMLKKADGNFDYELTGWSEIDKAAIKAHDAVYPEWADRNLGDISKIDWDNAPDFDLFTYSFPCTDLSKAGSQTGVTEGSGTRSSLLWECKKAIEAKKPRYLVMENVKDLVGKRFMPDFQKWLDYLESQGYKTEWEVLNSADYGVPQDRERVFAVSTLEDGQYHFPEKRELTKGVESIVEENVPDEFYFDDAKREKLGLHDSNIRYRFIGEQGASSADAVEEATTRLDNLATAKKMAKQKKDALAIKKATGWEMGADGKWRYEEPDGVLKEGWRNATTLGELWDDEALYKAYPEMRNMPVYRFVENNTGGEYSVQNDSLGLNVYGTEMNARRAEEAANSEYEWSRRQGEAYLGGLSASEYVERTMRGIVAHEIQHAIQHREGFAVGGRSRGSVNRVLSAEFKHADKFLDAEDTNRFWNTISGYLYDMTSGNPYGAKEAEIAIEGSLLNWNIKPSAEWNRVKKLRQAGKLTRDGIKKLQETWGENAKKALAPTEKFAQEYKEFKKRRNALKKIGASGIYYNLGGEAEARNVEKRIDMTYEERLNSLRTATQSVADEDQIFLFDALKKSNSEGGTRFRTTYHGSGADFEEFDHKHMGEGEGNQAFGWGTYVTDVEGVGRGYANTALKEERVKKMQLEHAIFDSEKELNDIKSELDWYGSDETARKRLERVMANLERTIANGKKIAETEGKDSEQYKENLRKQQSLEEMKMGWEEKLSLPGGYQKSLEAKLDEAQKKVDDAQNALDEHNASLVGKRHLYTVEIPDNDGTNYIDWQKDYSRKEVDEIVNRLEDYTDTENLSDYLMNHDDVIKGADIYQRLERLLGHKLQIEGGDVMTADKETSLLLSKAGFVGIEYQTNSQRGGNNRDEKNYVIFKEPDARITDHVRFRTAEEKDDAEQFVSTRFSIRTKPEPKKVKKAYKLMRLVDGELHPLFIGGNEVFEMGTWYDGDAPNLDLLFKAEKGIWVVTNTKQEEPSIVSFEEYKKQHPEVAGKAERKNPNNDDVKWAQDNGMYICKVKDIHPSAKDPYGTGYGYEVYGINGSADKPNGEGSASTYALRSGVHFGEVPSMHQIGYGGERDVRLDNQVWVEVEMAADRHEEYQNLIRERMAKNPGHKDLPHMVLDDGYYIYSTNPVSKKTKGGDSEADKTKADWYVAGAFRPVRILSDAEADKVVEDYNAAKGTKVPLDHRREGGKMFNAETGGFDMPEGGGVRFRVSDIDKDYERNEDADFSQRRDGESLDDFRERATTEAVSGMRFKSVRGEWSGEELSMRERINKAKMVISEHHKDDLQKRSDAVESITKEMKNISRLLFAQRDYDRSTVNLVADLASTMANGDWMENATSLDVKRALSALKEANGREDITKQVDTIAELMVTGQLKKEQSQLEKLMKIKTRKTDATGVNVMGRMDARAVQVVEGFKKWINATPEDIVNEIESVQQKLNDSNDGVRESANIRFEALNLAYDYAVKVKRLEAEEAQMWQDLEDEKARRTEDRNSGKTFHYDDTYQSLYDTTKRAIVANRLDRSEALQGVLDGLTGVVKRGMEGAKAFREREQERINEIHHDANSDMQGVDVKLFDHQAKDEGIENKGLVNFATSSLATAEQIFRSFGGKTAGGEGKLFDRFIRGFHRAKHDYYARKNETKAQLDDIAQQFFGTKWDNVYGKMRKMSGLAVTVKEFNKERTYELSQGNAMYLYMLNKQLDGRMKLEHMGIGAEQMAYVEESLDPRVKAMADYMQSEYLTEKRNGYNDVHLRLFGAPMAEIDNYVPIKILSSARQKTDADLQNDGNAPLPSARTGAIIERKRNVTPVDLLGADGLSVLEQHLDEMDKWAATAEFNRDVATLLKYNRFENAVKSMRTIYGGGDMLWQKTQDALNVLTGNYKAKGGSGWDKVAMQAARLVTGAKVAFRNFTALKQTTSLPAFMSDSDPLTLSKNLAEMFAPNSPVTKNTFTWAMENLPMFKERVEGRKAGDYFLTAHMGDFDYHKHNWLNAIGRGALWTNSMVDAMTCAVGARSVYETKMRQYEKAGLDKETAHERAVIDAEIAFNQSQQSSEEAYVSPMQVDRTVGTAIFTAFRNGPFGYGRRFTGAIKSLANTMRDPSEMLRKTTNKWVAQGLDESKARAEARKQMARQTLSDMAAVALFGYGLQFVWNIMPSVPYLLTSDNDDEKKKILEEAYLKSASGGVEGLAGGKDLSDIIGMALSGGDFSTYSFSKLPAVSDLEMVVKEMGSDKWRAATDAVNLVTQALVGVNPQVGTDIVVATIDALHGDLETSKEFALWFARVNQLPQSQIEKIYLDEVDLTAKDAQKMSPKELAERYAKYKVMRNAPLAVGFNLYDDVDLQAAESRQKNNIEGKMKERILGGIGTDVSEQYNDMMDATADMRKRIKVAKTLPPLEQAQSMTNMLTDHRSELMQAVMFEKYNSRLNQLAGQYLKAQTDEQREAIRKAMETLKHDCLKNIDKMSK